MHHRAILVTQKSTTACMEPTSHIFEHLVLVNFTALGKCHVTVTKTDVPLMSVPVDFKLLGLVVVWFQDKLV